jgi:hypothetical protein
MLPESTTHPLEYYARPGPMTDPGEHADLFDGLPTEMSALCQVVQGLMLHIFWAEQHGVELAKEWQREVNIRQVAQMLTRIPWNGWGLIAKEEQDLSADDIKRVSHYGCGRRVQEALLRDRD